MSGITCTRLLALVVLCTGIHAQDDSLTGSFLSGKQSYIYLPAQMFYLFSLLTVYKTVNANLLLVLLVHTRIYPIPISKILILKRNVILKFLCLTVHWQFKFQVLNGNRITVPTSTFYVGSNVFQQGKSLYA